MFAIMGVIYAVIRDFGAGAQAGFGIGARVMQSVFLPAMALTFAVAPVAGQNFGARDAAAGARDLPPGGADRRRDHAGADPAVPDPARPAGPPVHPRRLHRLGGDRIPARRLVELRGRRAGVRLLGHVPGARRHPPGPDQQRHPAGHLRRARAVVLRRSRGCGCTTSGCCPRPPCWCRRRSACCCCAGELRRKLGPLEAEAAMPAAGRARRRCLNGSPAGRSSRSSERQPTGRRTVEPPLMPEDPVGRARRGAPGRSRWLLGACASDGAGAIPCRTSATPPPAPTWTTARR